MREEAEPPLWKTFAFALLQIGGYALGLIALLYATFVFLRVPPMESLRAIWVGAFGDAQSGHWYAISETLVKTTPLLLTGLGVVVAWRAGLFSIGGEGQLIVGAIAATFTARSASLASRPASHAPDGDCRNCGGRGVGRNRGLAAGAARGTGSHQHDYAQLYRAVSAWLAG